MDLAEAAELLFIYGLIRLSLLLAFGCNRECVIGIMRETLRKRERERERERENQPVANFLSPLVRASCPTNFSRFSNGAFS